MINFRQAKKSDIDFLLSLRKITMKMHIEDEGLEYNLDKQRDRVLFLYEKSKIIQKNNKDIGLLKIDKSQNPWKIIQLQLLPEFQNKGIGSHILQMVIEDSNKEGCSLELNVLKNNRAKVLYDRMGFVICSENDHAYIMRKIAR